MRTPRTIVPGSAQRGLPGGLTVMLSPAPLSTRARVLQRQRVAGGGVATACMQRARHPGAAGAAAECHDRINVVLPSPMPAAQQGTSARPLGLHNVRLDSAATEEQDPSRGKAPHRNPSVMLAEAVRAARRAAAEVVDEGEGGRDPRSAASAHPEDVHSTGARAPEHLGGGSMVVRVKPEREAAGVGPVSTLGTAPEVKLEGGDGMRTGKGRTAGKRRHGCA
jgi:hypothetical protein